MGHGWEGEAQEEERVRLRRREGEAQEGQQGDTDRGPGIICNCSKYIDRMDGQTIYI